jgi:hypothetical protein
MKHIKLTIGEKKYTINELPRRQNAAWREQFQEEFVEIAGFVQEIASKKVSNLIGSNGHAPDGQANEADAGETIAGIVEQVAIQVNGSIDRMANLLISYSPEMTADREHVEEKAYDSEILDGFTAVLGLAYPFGSLLSQLQTLAAAGRSSKRTMRN